MLWLKAFIAGFIATIVFHQGVVGLFWLMGAIPNAPWNMSAVPPLGVPQVISLAFFGGLWGVPVWWLIRRWHGAMLWLSALVAGAVGPTAVAMLVVFPLKGLAVGLTTVVGGLIVNGAWGIGVVCVMRWLFKVR
ncbi:hypothetical protein J1C54_13450 [Alcanivorax sp. 1008]|nr:hypothetical protein [Alcanivorax sp. 1008]